MMIGSEWVLNSNMQGSGRAGVHLCLRPSLFASKIRYGRMGDVEFKRAMTKYYELRQIAFFYIRLKQM